MVRKSLSLCAMSLLPIAAILYAVITGLQVQNSGTVYEFRLQGYDPIDLLRGRYLDIRLHNLSFDSTQITLEASAGKVTLVNHLQNVKPNTYYAEFTQDSLGFAQILRIQSIPPQSEMYANVLNFYYSYLEEAAVDSLSDSSGVNQVQIHNSQIEYSTEFDVKRMYLNESDIQEIEQKIIAATSDSSQLVSCKIAVYKGKMQIVDLLINRKSILDL